MKAQIVSTDQMVTIARNGDVKVEARVWEGTTERGVAFVAYIAYLQVNSAADNSEFENELREHKAPDVATQHAIDARMIF